MRGKRVVSRIGNVCNLRMVFCKMQQPGIRSKRRPSVFGYLAATNYGFGTRTETDNPGIVQKKALVAAVVIAGAVASVGPAEVRV